MPLNTPDQIRTWEQQVLVNLGNRFVLFGPKTGLPTANVFNPEIDSEILPRVADESEAAGHRITETLKVSGFETVRSRGGRDEGWDIQLVHPNGERVFVQIKVAERDLRQKDLARYFEYLTEAVHEGQEFQVWSFNIEKLKLTILSNPQSPQIEDLNPIDVWEQSEKGIFPRSRVVRGVDEWARRIEALYDQIAEWAIGDSDIEFDRTRTVVMSEELMRKFAVADRELSILDVVLRGSSVMSFVPRGRWIIGARGRIDVITQATTFMLVDRGDDDTARWTLVSREDRRKGEGFNAKVFANLLEPNEQADGY